jgi:hypothetical protein
MSAQIIEKDGRPAQLYHTNTWESGACSACADEKLSEAAGWISGSNGYNVYPTMGWGTLAAGVVLGYLIFKGKA